MSKALYLALPDTYITYIPVYIYLYEDVNRLRLLLWNCFLDQQTIIMMITCNLGS